MLGRKGWAALSTATLAASALVLYFQASQRQSDEKPGPEFASVGEPAPAQTSDPEVIVAGQEASPSEPAPEHISGVRGTEPQQKEAQLIALTEHPEQGIASGEQEAEDTFRATLEQRADRRQAITSDENGPSLQPTAPVHAPPASTQLMQVQARAKASSSNAPSEQAGANYPASQRATHPRAEKPGKATASQQFWAAHENRIQTITQQFWREHEKRIEAIRSTWTASRQ